MVPFDFVNMFYILIVYYPAPLVSENGRCKLCVFFWSELHKTFYCCDIRMEYAMYVDVCNVCQLTIVVRSLYPYIFSHGVSPIPIGVCFSWFFHQYTKLFYYIYNTPNKVRQHAVQLFLFDRCSISRNEPKKNDILLPPIQQCSL